MEAQVVEAKLKSGTELAFLLAGKATFTVRSLKTGTRYTYRVNKAKTTEHQPEIWFVKLLTGPDNNTCYQYVGMIKNNKFVLTKASKYTASSVPVVAFTWLFTRLVAGSTIQGVELWHAGHCGRCGRQLTVPESVEAGFGPECIQLVGGISKQSNFAYPEKAPKALSNGVNCPYCGEQVPGCRCERKAEYARLEAQQEELAFMSDIRQQESL